VYFTKNFSNVGVEITNDLRVISNVGVEITNDLRVISRIND
jgi:hypothetical protein